LKEQSWKCKIKIKIKIKIKNKENQVKAKVKQIKAKVKEEKRLRLRLRFRKGKDILGFVLFVIWYYVGANPCVRPKQVYAGLRQIRDWVKV
jgi:hypothetical protein